MQIKSLSIITLFVSLFLFQSPLQAQYLGTKAGDFELGAQLGLLSIYRIDRAKTIVPPLQLQGDYFVAPNFSVGAFASYVAAEADRHYASATITEAYRNQTWAVGLRTTAYSNVLGEQWRIYGGIALGATLPQIETVVSLVGEPKVNELEIPRFSREPSNSMLFSGYVGTQYYLNATISLTAEVGYGLSLLNVGLRYRL